MVCGMRGMRLHHGGEVWQQVTGKMAREVSLVGHGGDEGLDWLGLAGSTIV